MNILKTNSITSISQDFYIENSYVLRFVGILKTLILWNSLQLAFTGCQDSLIKSTQNATLFPANICWSSRRLQNVFSVTVFRLPRRLENVLKRLENALEHKKLLRWRRLETCLEKVLNKSWRCLEDVLKTSWRHPEDVWRPLCRTSWKHLEDVLKMSWRCFCKTSWRCLKDVLKTSS